MAWRSPISAMVSVSGSVQCVDTLVSGISWQLDQGSDVLLGPSEMTDDSPASFGPLTIPVSQGETLYFEVGLSAHANGASDSTAVGLTITTG